MTPKVAGLAPSFTLQVTTLGKLFTSMCLCHQTVSFGTGQGVVMPWCWPWVTDFSDLFILMGYGTLYLLTDLAEIGKQLKMYFFNVQ